MAADARVGADHQVRGCHGPVGIVGGEQLGHEVHPACPNRLDDALVRGLRTPAFQTGDRRLGGAKAFRELTLGEPSSPPRFPDQISRPHGENIADTL